MQLKRRAVTFIEVMVVVAIGSILIMMVVQWQARFSTMFGTAVADLALQSDARGLFDNITQDMSSAVLVGTGKADKIDDFDWKADQAGQVLTIVRMKKDPRLRHSGGGQDKKKTQYAGYPHYSDSGEPVVQKWPAIRCVYEVETDPQDPKKRMRMFRSEEDGTFERKEETPKCDREPGWSYSFKGGRPGRRMQVANRITKLMFVPLAFLPKAPPPAGQPAPPPPPEPAGQAVIPGFLPPERFFSLWQKSKPCAQLYHITAMGVHYVAEDVKTGATGAEGRVELVSKFYMEERSAAYRFDHAFSSVDEHL